MQIDVEKVKSASDKLRKSLELIKSCQSKEQLRGFEGEAASVYFGVLDELILQQKKEFTFQGRNKRPPLDHVKMCIRDRYSDDGRTLKTLSVKYCSVYSDTAGIITIFSGRCNTKRIVSQMQGTVPVF